MNNYQILKIYSAKYRETGLFLFRLTYSVKKANFSSLLVEHSTLKRLAFAWQFKVSQQKTLKVRKTGITTLHYSS